MTIDAGAPLAIREDILIQLPEIKNEYSFRIISPSALKEFAISEDLVDKFNSWRNYTLPEQPALSNHITATSNETLCFIPPRFVTSTLEYAMEIQLILITAWRIGRYGTKQSEKINLTYQPFFTNAPQHPDISVEPYDAKFSRQATAVLALEYEKKAKDIAEKTSLRDKEKRQ